MKEDFLLVNGCELLLKNICGDFEEESSEELMMEVGDY